MKHGERPRPCERQCVQCHEWKHYSKFHVKGVKKAGNRSDAHHVRFSPRCDDCAQINRNIEKNKDRPLSIIKDRARAAATKAGASFDFFWTNMNYRALVPMLRAMMSDEGLCFSCGHKFRDQSDIQIEHRAAPRHPQDWARLHARNLGLFCKSCNGKKARKPYDEWLDQEESTRRSNELGIRVAEPKSEVKPEKQLGLFEF